MSLMNKDQPLEKCGRCGTKDRFTIEIIFRKPFYNCNAPLASGAICRRSVEISRNAATADRQR